MPRPKKCRQICAMPKHGSFGPIGCSKHSGDAVSMALDEYETIRLIDLLGYTQEDCALQMGVARTTVQSVYCVARFKLADALVNGKKLLIHGGDVALCARSEGCLQKRCCRKNKINNGGNENENCGNL